MNGYTNNQNNSSNNKNSDKIDVSKHRKLIITTAKTVRIHHQKDTAYSNVNINNKDNNNSKSKSNNENQKLLQRRKLQKWREKKICDRDKLNRETNKERKEKAFAKPTVKI